MSLLYASSDRSNRSLLFPLSPPRSLSCSILLRVCSALLLASLATAHAQTPSTPLPPGNAADTLQVNTRIVLTDVTVTDDHGNPVHGLSRPQFHIFDDGHPQTISSFEAHKDHPEVTPAVNTAPGVYTNLGQNAPSTINVLLIDTTTMGWRDQTIAYLQLKKFVQRLRPGQPVAVFTRSGQAMVLLQTFTDDHALLLKAIEQAVPHLNNPDRILADDASTLEQIASYLEQVPGRKNVLWFSGGSAGLLFDGEDVMPSLRPTYDLLVSERIVIYPIDVRGLMVMQPLGVAMQQSLMDQEATATGGQATFNKNRIARAATHDVNIDGDYYTLTYSPNDLKQNDKWHKVKITLNVPGYHLSYRRGYFDDATMNSAPYSARERTVLAADGSITRRSPSASAIDRQPILFQATVLPAAVQAETANASFKLSDVPAKRRTVTYALHYVLPAKSISPYSVQGGSQIDHVGASIVAYNELGLPIGHTQERASFTVAQDMLDKNPSLTLNFYQQITLPKGKIFLNATIMDLTSHRFGMVSLPVQVEMQPKQ
ncbi:MAG: VWA domain-containing protein [Acidobacteria bacterium]|nr:VWA domain-containing protein [Acidobacteriota bacterium]